ncbi:hypothetical protein ADK43_27215 [Streptomyces rimosus subsp. rimosus]|nr:hypothetical protein ADK43_27215 [Streptomyces rimosus subsp. rimosus]
MQVAGGAGGVGDLEEDAARRLGERLGGQGHPRGVAGRVDPGGGPVGAGAGHLRAQWFVRAAGVLAEGVERFAVARLQRLLTAARGEQAESGHRREPGGSGPQRTGTGGRTGTAAPVAVAAAVAACGGCLRNGAARHGVSRGRCWCCMLRCHLDLPGCRLTNASLTDVARSGREGARREEWRGRREGRGAAGGGAVPAERRAGST